MDWLRQVPIGQYVSGNSSWLRVLDPRLKLAWVMMFLLTPVLAGPFWRVCLAGSLLLMTILSGVALRVWWRSLLLLLGLSVFVGLLSIFLPIGESAASIAIRPPQELPSAFFVAKPWNLFKFGPIQIGPIDIGPLLVNRRSAELGLNTSTLIFTVIQSVNLMLLTTPSEDLMWALQWTLSPLVCLGIPVDRISFQLLLSLRFLPLVQEEFQNLLRSLSSRAVNLKSLGFKAFWGLILSVGERLLANILLRAEQGADAFLARGGKALMAEDFRPDGLTNKSHFWINVGSGFLLILVISLRRKYGNL